MTGKLIQAAILYGAYRFGNQQVKAMALGVAGVMISNYVPFLNGKNLKGEAI